MISTDGSAIQAPNVGDILNEAEENENYTPGLWTCIEDGDVIEVANGTHIGVAEIDESNAVIQFSDATAVVR
jgi:hypothetical protein